MHEYYRLLTGEALAEALAGENVLVQLEHLLAIHAVTESLNRGRVKLHGWPFESGSLYAYGVVQEQFVPMDLALATAG